MFYSFDTIEKMGYKYVSDFVSYMVKVYRYNCSIQYADNGIFISGDFDSQEGVSNMGEIMTEQRRKDAIEYIMGQLEDGYIDLGLHDQDELMIVEEAMELLIEKESLKMTNNEFKRRYDYA